MVWLLAYNLEPEFKEFGDFGGTELPFSSLILCEWIFSYIKIIKMKVGVEPMLWFIMPINHIDSWINDLTHYKMHFW